MSSNLTSKIGSIWTLSEPVVNLCTPNHRIAKTSYPEHNSTFSQQGKIDEPGQQTRARQRHASET